jgi:hypothetical protein
MHARTALTAPSVTCTCCSHPSHARTHTHTHTHTHTRTHTRTRARAVLIANYATLASGGEAGAASGLAISQV